MEATPNPRRSGAEILSWVILGLYIVSQAGSLWIGALWLLGFPLAFLFALCHGSRRYGWGGSIAFCLIGLTVSIAFENLGVATGFPFGHYYWSASATPGPWIGAVPLLTGIAYVGTGYIAWILAHVLLDATGSQGNTSDRFVLPLIAAFVMVMWDMAMDPWASTVAKAWIWRDGGGFFGVPVTNFLGWYLVIWTVYQLFSLFISVRNRERKATSIDFWYQAVIFYFFIGLYGLLPSKLGSTETATDPSGTVWKVSDIYEGLLTICLFTMGFVCVLCICKLRRRSAA